MSLDEPTWIDQAVERGWRVGYFGKWHLGTDGPTRRGAHGHDPKTDPGKPYDPATSQFSYASMAARYEAQSKTLIEGRAPFWGVARGDKESFQPFSSAQAGIRFLEEWAARKSGQPFFLTVSSAPPHFPHILPREYADKARALEAQLPASIGDAFENKPPFHSMPWWPCMDTRPIGREEWRTIIAFSHAHIMMVDEAIGRLLDALDRLGLAEETAVVFTADHGDMEGAHNRFDKGPYFYEEVWRIPLVVRWPGRPAARQDAFVSILDVGQTLFGLIGAGADPAKPRSGCDLAPLVGASVRPDRWPQEAYGVYDLYNGMSFAVRAIRDERYKYVWNPQAMDEFYDLAADPAEMCNLDGLDAARPQRDRLRARLFEWINKTGDDLPERVAALPPAGTILATGEMGP